MKWEENSNTAFESFCRETTRCLMTRIHTANKVHYADMSTLMNIYRNIQKKSPLVFLTRYRGTRLPRPSSLIYFPLSVVGCSTRLRGESLISLRKRKKIMEKKDEKRQMRDFLSGLINQQTRAGAVRGLLRKGELFPSFTASANHLPPFNIHASTQTCSTCRITCALFQMAVFGWHPSPHRSDCGAAALTDWCGSKSCKTSCTFGAVLLLKPRVPSK